MSTKIFSFFLLIGLLFLMIACSPVESDPYRDLQTILDNFDATHTYSEVDDVMCVDLSSELWNVLKTAGYNVEICIGNVDEDISGEEDLLNWINRMNHAWVLVEAEPFTWIAAESTTGKLIFAKDHGTEYDIENDFYYEGECFKNPAEYKEFAVAEEKAYEFCDEYDSLVIYWNENIAGEFESRENIELEGRMNLLEEQCTDALNVLEKYLS